MRMMVILASSPGCTWMPIFNHDCAPMPASVPMPGMWGERMSAMFRMNSGITMLAKRW